MWTTKDPTDPICKLVSAKQSLGFDHFALAVDPLGLYGVEPRALLGHKAAHDSHSVFAPAVFDPAVVLTEPAPDLLADVPASVVPDEEQDFLAKSLELLGAPRERNCVVMELTGRPSTNRSHVSSRPGR
jgi:hypothetical protein